MGYVEIQKRTPVQNLITGSIAGSSVFVSTLPLDYVKQWKQSGHTIYDINRNIRQNGYRVLFRGGLIGSAVIAPQIATKLGALSIWNNIIPKNDNNSVTRKMKLGFLAGFVDGFIFGPILAIQSYQQLKPKETVIKSFNTIKKSSLIKYCYPLAYRNAFYTMPVFGLVYPLQNNIFTRKNKTIERHISEIFVSASILNIFGTLLCSPFDVIRAQQIKLLTEKKNNNMLEIIKDLWNKKGVKGFYNGYGSLFINFAMRFPLTLMVNEYLGYHFYK